MGTGAGGSLGGGDDAEDSCAKPLEFDDGRAGTCWLVVVSRVSTGLDGRARERPVGAAAARDGGSVVSLGGGGSVVSLGGGGSVVMVGGAGGGVVLNGCGTRVSARSRPRTPGETATAPANTRTASAAAATTAAPMTLAPTTKALCIDSASGSVIGLT
jgi:hypothetical protein